MKISENLSLHPDWLIICWDHMEYIEKNLYLLLVLTILTDINFMTTYTITIDEKTKSGKSLIAYLRSLGIVQEPDETTLKAVKELKDGKVTRCSSFEDYLAKVQ